MQVRKGKNQREKWNLGNLQINNCDEYKYLGDVIARNQSNKKNLEAREKKLKSITAVLFSIAKSETLRNMELKVLLELYEVVIVPGILFNCEAWTLTKSDMEKLEAMQTWTLKKNSSITKNNSIYSNNPYTKDTIHGN